MKDILNEFKSILCGHGIYITEEIEEEIFASLRLIYKRMEGDIINRKIENIELEEI